jgi:uncharacterized RDD family membrane protein YckC
MTADFAPVMNSRFQPDADHAPESVPTLIDPEAFDVSEQQFAASLEEKSTEPRPRFVLEHMEPPVEMPGADEPSAAGNQNSADAAEANPGSRNIAAVAAEATPDTALGPDSWRREVAARVDHYRGRRPRAPRYPSLELRFEPSEPIVSEPASQPRPAACLGQLAITMDPEPAAVMESHVAQPTDDAATSAPSEGATKILEFPRSSLMHSAVVDELAEPVFDRPRILEVPEVLPPPPALGGILIEPSYEPKDDRRPGFELPLKPAPRSRRILAGMSDAMVVGAAFAGFAYIFIRITSVVPPVQQGAAVGAALLATFWAAYQYLLLVHTGSTPGLKLARLELSRFDGSPVPRRLRRWRVLASVLSGLSLALGYVWCFLDEDELCWHDRITHTYMAPKAGRAAPPATPH